MEDEFFLSIAAGVGVKFLGVLGGAQRNQGDGLGFAAAEQRRAVGAGQQTRLAHNGADVIKAAAIQALVFVHDQAAKGLLLDIVEGFFQDGFGNFFHPEFLHQLRPDFVRDRLDGGLAFELLVGQERRNQTLAGQFLGFGQNVIRHDAHGDVAFFLAGAGGQILLRLDEGLAGFMAELQGGGEIRLGNLLGGSFEHDDVGGIADINEVQVAFARLAVGWVGDEFTVQAPDADGAQGALPGNIADR